MSREDDLDSLKETIAASPINDGEAAMVVPWTLQSRSETSPGKLPGDLSIGSKEAASRSIG
ncbi:hypothetical protein [Thermosporothrix hazakensis]|uniref:hypothetical protein n=1 Tax=Thermosporothrix hazakensis TaxID=644383 RepID=UPI001B870267|nr:hypothetical protein [Thermosporothrix hazakensis]